MKNNQANTIITKGNDKYILIGVVIGVVGLRGNVKISAYTEEPSDILAFKAIYNSDGELDIHMNNMSLVYEKSNCIVVSIKGRNTREEAEQLISSPLYVDKKELDAQKEDEDEYYHVDLIGLNVIYQDSDDIIGRVTNVMNYGATDIIEISKHEDNKVLMHPFTKKHVPIVDLKNKFIKILNIY